MAYGGVAVDGDLSNYQQMIESITEYEVIRLDEHGVIRTWHAGAQRLTGYTADEVLGQSVTIFYTQDEGIRLDGDGAIRTWHAGAQRLTGYTADEVIGQHVSMFYTEEDARAGRADRELPAAVRDGRFETEGWRMRKDGSRFWANVI